MFSKLFKSESFIKQHKIKDMKQCSTLYHAPNVVHKATGQMSSNKSDGVHAHSCITRKTGCFGHCKVTLSGHCAHYRACRRVGGPVVVRDFDFEGKQCQR